MAKVKALKKKRPLNWNECYAKVVLEDLFPSRFFHLKIIDKPDLQNEETSIGIEVVTAVGENAKKNKRAFSVLRHNIGTANQLQNAKDHLNKTNGRYYDNGVMLSWGDTVDLSNTREMLKKKLEKLNNGGYKDFENRYLFIVLELAFLPEESEILSLLESLQNDYHVKFDSIFLLNNNRKLIEFNMKEMSYQSFVCDYEKLAEEAYKLYSRSNP